ncbi:HAD family hydrolase [Sunxiuqinia sp. A32]|uniref:HAD family hydrolase n=1 Tax=Sunxiuqinia sp. A32 TaxID=3461496 RepID=UPI00404526B3
MIVKQTIKNIIFDLGGVLLDIDPLKTIQAFEKLGLSGVIDEGGWSYNHPVFLKLEQGQLSDVEFRNEIRSLLPSDTSDEEINAAWCAMIIDFPAEKVELLKALSNSFKLFLFSNTNTIHLSFFRQLFRKKFDIDLDDLFSDTFYSHEIGLRKPLADSFVHVINNAGIVAEESLFIDDSRQNTEGAEALGIQTIHLARDKKLHKIFEGYY